ncbi:lipopolysaccharide biosynthesis protein [Virgibacillus necropolis]|uniref:Polysaccharide biosynthesis protein n=1 Tax=Virgibacillus necropolis TaxID=163877 RepID=A0A221M9E1_9BACI|nr:oligosaccharide flippase family protein [Virgibacillus necropolis]ASN04230.1 polysaccharide biosynthesis protein [Virgibacillus necropolis]
MKDKLVSLSRKPFVRNVFIMATGTAAAQIITMAFSPIITRMYGPESFGVLGVFMAMVGIIGPVAALTYPIAIVLPKSDANAKGLVRLALYITLIVTVVATLILILFNRPLARLLQIEEISPFLYLVPLVVLFSGVLQVVQQWLIRNKQFGITARVTSLHALLLQSSIVGVGLFYPMSIILVTLSTAGQALKAFMLFIGVRKSQSKGSKTTYKPVSLKKLAKKYRDFPLFRAPEVFLNAASQSLPILLLTSFFGPASAGFYTLGKTVLGAPSQLIGKSVGDVFYPRISEAAKNHENLSNLITKATIALGAIGIIPFGLVIIFGPWLFSFVFGENWVIAGEYARWIALWYFFGFMNKPCVRALPVLSAQAFHLIFTLLMLIIRVTVLAIGYYVFASDLVAIAFFGVSGAILNICLILITIRISKNYDNQYGDIK